MFWRPIAIYLTATAILNLAWEFAHMPLYTLWQRGSASEIIYAGIHCTLGDVMIAAFALIIGIAIFGRSIWPTGRWMPVAITTIIIGLGYTVFSEWLNISVRRSWEYSELMPLIPGTETGLSPVLQWIVIPTLALVLSSSKRARNEGKTSRWPSLLRTHRDQLNAAIAERRKPN